MERRETGSGEGGPVHRVKVLVELGRSRLQRTLVWRVWERMLEIEFLDRSVALAGKAFVSFFPLVIVVAAFMPQRTRQAIFTSLTTRIGVEGDALELAREAFTSAEDVRQATGALGLILTIFFAASFTTALQRIYMRAWRRPPGLKAGSYTRGIIWLAAFLLYLTATGALARALGDGLGLAVFLVLVAATSVAWWWFSSWYLLLGHVRWRALLPGALASAATMSVYGATAGFWMPGVVTRNQEQFGFFGIAMALITWFSGVAICLVIGACTGPVVAEEPGPLGRLVRGHDPELLTPGAPPALPGPLSASRLRDAFRPARDDAEPYPG